MAIDYAAADHPPIERLPISWDRFHHDSRALARRLSLVGPFAALVAVTRGGLVPAAVVARELSIRVVETLSVASYAGEVQGVARVLKPVAPTLARDGGSGLLVVDDLVDTGVTARLIRAALPRAHFACVYAKPAGRPLVDSFVTAVPQDTWIDFPWDLGLSFQAPLVVAG